MSEEAKSASPNGPERRRRERRWSAFISPGGWVRRLARLWGFLGFAVFVVFLARHVILPFVFAVLVAYILAPVVQFMSIRANGTMRMPRWLAIISCYIVFLAILASFVMLLLPRLSNDATRIARELPTLYEKLNNEWTPGLAHWLEERFPVPAPPPQRGADPTTPKIAPASPGDATPVTDVPLPSGTAIVIVTLPDGRQAVQLPPGGLDIHPRSDGGFHVTSDDKTVDSAPIGEVIRTWTGNALAGLESQVGDLVRVGQAIVTGLVSSVFSFFLVLMVAAFILLDLEKLRGFVRSLVPAGHRGDYDVIVVGINHGLAGVIRGQLLICLVNGILTYIGLAIFSIKYSLILAVVAGVMSLIPIFGSILSTIPIVAAALVSGEAGLDIARAVFALAWIIGIHFLEANMLNPKIIGTAAKIHPVLVIFALIVGEHSYGLVGALLAVPVTSMIQVLFLFFRNKAWKHEGNEAGALARAEDDPGSITSAKV